MIIIACMCVCMCAGVVWHNIANRSYMHVPISLNVLRTCADQLHSIQSYIFNLPLSHGTVPMIWKICCIVPVPKNKTKQPVKAMNGLRSVALTSCISKTFERVILVHLQKQVAAFMDSLQFAYRKT